MPQPCNSKTDSTSTGGDFEKCLGHVLSRMLCTHNESSLFSPGRIYLQPHPVLLLLKRPSFLVAIQIQQNNQLDSFFGSRGEDVSIAEQFQTGRRDVAHSDLQYRDGSQLPLFPGKMAFICEGCKIICPTNCTQLVGKNKHLK